MSVICPIKRQVISLVRFRKEEWRMLEQKRQQGREKEEAAEMVQRAENEI